MREVIEGSEIRVGRVILRSDLESAVEFIESLSPETNEPRYSIT